MSDLFEALRLFTTNTGSRSRFDVGGELDVATVGPFGDHLALLVDAGSGDVDVDMALVTFCDAATLRVLVTAHHQLSARGRRLRVINGSRPVLRLLTVTALDTMLLGPITEADASLASCRPDWHHSDVAPRARKE
jgi:anti-anti-sigma factor